MSINVQALVCEDFRPEVDGNFSIVGVYPGPIFVPTEEGYFDRLQIVVIIFGTNEELNNVSEIEVTVGNNLPITHSVHPKIAPDTAFDLGSFVTSTSAADLPIKAPANISVRVKIGSRYKSVLKQPIIVGDPETNRVAYENGPL